MREGLKTVCLRTAARVVFCLPICLFLCSGSSQAADWPTYRADNQRSGVTTEELVFPLKVSHIWVHEAAQTPQPSTIGSPPQQSFWQGLYYLAPKTAHDRAQHVAVAGDSVYIGSFDNDKVFRLDIETGAVRWGAFTEGPIRMAPSVANGKVYVGSDDGRVYCFDAADGALVWSYRAGPRDERVMGQGRMISRWPVRTGVVVEDGVAYFAAGLFPSEGVYLCALDAETGVDAGVGLYKRGINDAPTGYMLSSATNLYMPRGKMSPVAYTRSTGSGLGAYGGRGGTFALLAQGSFFYGPQLTGTVGEFRESPGDSIASSGALQMVVFGSEAYLLNPASVSAVARSGGSLVWSAPASQGYSLILAGSALFVGGQDEVTAYDSSTGDVLWSAEVQGKAYGLAVADSRLFVSTDTGAVYAFADDTVTVLPPGEATASIWIVY